MSSFFPVEFLRVKLKILSWSALCSVQGLYFKKGHMVWIE